MCQVTERQTVLSLMTWISKEGKQGWENKKAKCVWQQGLPAEMPWRRAQRRARLKETMGGTMLAK